VTVRWIVDGMNVIGSRADGWWRDREGAMNRFAEDLRSHAAASGDEITVVFDGRRFPSAPPSGGGLEVVFAPGGRNSADDEISRRVNEDADPATLRVVTSDRDLQDRVSSAGAAVVSARALNRWLEEGGAA
jgi:predicted RNA-binding protein with PIN domain